MRYYFDEVGKFRIGDLRGRDFQRDRDAIDFARRLADDIRSLETISERGDVSICVLSEHGSTIHEELVFGK